MNAISFDHRTLMTRIMIGIVIIEQPIDVLTTNRALHYNMVEANPIQLFAMEHMGSYYWLPKLAIVLLFLALLYQAKVIKSPVVLFVAALVAKFYFVVCLNTYFMWW